jgi:Adenylate and Guanylate cyclase catalytic domain
MNTAARMEQTGAMNMIQITQATADLLIAAGKEHWITPRETVIEVKGKGKLQTYWAHPIISSYQDSTLCETETATDMTEGNESDRSSDLVNRLLMDKTLRLVDWNVDIMQKVLKLVVAQRQITNNRLKESAPVDKHAHKGKGPRLDAKTFFNIPYNNSNGMTAGANQAANAEYPAAIGASTHSSTNKSEVDASEAKPQHWSKRVMPLEEVVEIVSLPKFDGKVALRPNEVINVELPEKSVEQLRKFVMSVAAM